MKSMRSWGVALGVVFALLLVLVAFRIITVWNDSGTVDPEAAGSPVGDAEGGTPIDQREVVEVVGILDSFARPNDSTSLGSVPVGPLWSAEIGTWGTSNEQAYVAGPAAGRNHVVVRAGSEGAAQVKLTSMVHGAGLIFRFAGPRDHWALVAVPSYATFALVRTVDGREEIVGNTGLSPIGDGTTVAVRMAGPVIDLVLNGRVVETVVDETFSDADGVGLTAESIPGVDAAAARFDDFSFDLSPSEPEPGSRDVLSNEDPSLSSPPRASPRGAKGPS
jgi:hypothetical protein